MVLVGNKTQHGTGIKPVAIGVTSETRWETQGGTTKSTFALGDKDSSTLRDRGSNFQSQLEFYLRFNLHISSMLRTTPVTAPSL